MVVATINKPMHYPMQSWRYRVNSGRSSVLSVHFLDDLIVAAVVIASHADSPTLDSDVLFLVLLSHCSNDDLALRKDFYSNRRARGSRGGEGSKVKLTPAEVLVLCWERGLLRSQQWPDAKSRRKAMASGSGGAAAVVDEPIPEAAATAMLSR